MKRTLLIAVLILSLAVAAVRAQQAAQPKPAPQPQTAGQGTRPGTIVSTVNLVDVLFSVETKRNKLVTDLNKEDFKVFDDGVQQEITLFSQPTDLPLRIGMVLDTSNSIRDRLKFEQEAAIDFLFNAIRRETDQAFLMTFDDGPEIINPFSGDAGALRDTILKQRAGGGTALYDAVYAASQYLLTKSPIPRGPNADVRRVLLVISDGDDNSSERSRGDAIEMAQRAGVIIYTISTSTNNLNEDDETDSNKQVQRKFGKDEGDRVLDQLASETGGRSFFPFRADDLGQSFLDIGDELRHQYALAYSPAGRVPDGRFHTIRIQVNRKDVILRARKGYYAVQNPPLNEPPQTP
jgi:Ca-activated chloride channel homolog